MAQHRTGIRSRRPGTALLGRQGGINTVLLSRLKPVFFKSADGYTVLRKQRNIECFGRPSIYTAAVTRHLMLVGCKSRSSGFTTDTNVTPKYFTVFDVHFKLENPPDFVEFTSEAHVPVVKLLRIKNSSAAVAGQDVLCY